VQDDETPAEWACRIYLFAPLAVWMCRMMKHQQYVWACSIYLFAPQAVWDVQGYEP
jgi:hypothetical protein